MTGSARAKVRISPGIKTIFYCYDCERTELATRTPVCKRCNKALDSIGQIELKEEMEVAGA